MTEKIKYGLPRSKSLKSKILIDQLFKNGKYISQHPLRLVYLPVDYDKEEAFLVGFSVPKKKFKRAVDRNRIKRLMREAFRLQQHNLQLPQKTLMMWIYTGKELPEYEEVYKLISAIIEQLKSTNKK